MIVTGFAIGMCLSGLTLLILRQTEFATDDKFGSAIASFAAWCAFGMLVIAGSFALGLLIPGLAAAAILTVLRFDFGHRLRPIARYKLPLGVGAVLCSVLTWIGILNLLEELPNG